MTPGIATLQCFSSEGSNMFSREWIGCGSLLLSFSPEKCSLISSQLAATQGQGSIDNQSIWQLVNCPGCWLGAPGALSTSAGKDKSALLSPVPASIQLLLESFRSSAWMWNTVSRELTAHISQPWHDRMSAFVIGAKNLYCFSSLCRDLERFLVMTLSLH